VALIELYLHCTNGGVESRTSVEAEPAEPDEDRSKENQGSVVRLAVRWLTSTLALAEHEGVGQTCPARSNVNRSASSVVERRQVEKPSIGIPSPAGDRTVDNGGPEESEDQARQDASTLCTVHAQKSS